MPNKINIIITAGLTDNKLISKLHGLIHCELIDTIFLIRKKSLNINHRRLKIINPPEYIKHSAILFEPWRLYTLILISLKNKIDLIYVIQPVPHSIPSYINSKIFNKPLIISVIGSDVYIYLKKPIFGYFLSKIILYSSAVTVLGETSKQKLLEKGYNHKKIFQILEYIDKRKFAINSGIKKKWDFIYVGSLIPIKNLKLLIEAFSIVLKKISSVRLCILGDGIDKDDLIALAEKLEVINNIDFISKTNNVQNYLQQSKVFVMTSKSEGLPAAALEASFCGLPVILPDIGDISTIYEHNHNALLFKSEQLDDIVICLLNICQNNKLYNQLYYGSRNLRHQYIKNWDFDGQVSAWNKLLQKITNNRSE